MHTPIKNMKFKVSNHDQKCLIWISWFCSNYYFVTFFKKSIFMKKIQVIGKVIDMVIKQKARSADDSLVRFFCASLGSDSTRVDTSDIVSDEGQVGHILWESLMQWSEKNSYLAFFSSSAQKKKRNKVTII